MVLSMRAMFLLLALQNVFYRKAFKTLSTANSMHLTIRKLRNLGPKLRSSLLCYGIVYSSALSTRYWPVRITEWFMTAPNYSPLIYSVFSSSIWSLPCNLVCSISVFPFQMYRVIQKEVSRVFYSAYCCFQFIVSLVLKESVPFFKKNW